MLHATEIQQRRAMWPECIFTFALGSCYRALARVLENVWYSDSLTKSYYQTQYSEVLSEK